jgi:phosphoglycolate phosphatase
MKYQAVIFDVDGTLLDSLEDLADSMNVILQQFGFPVHHLDRYKYFVGDGMENLVRRSLPEERRQDEAVVAECFARMREEYGKRWKTKTHLYEGISELLDSLAGLGVRMSVLSNKPDDFTKKVVKELLGRWRFEHVFGERSSVPRKPDPAAALEIAQLSRISPDGFLYLGDTATDMRTASAAGMFAVGALWGFRQSDELLSGGAKVLIGNPLELLHLL